MFQFQPIIFGFESRIATSYRYKPFVRLLIGEKNLIGGGATVQPHGRLNISGAFKYKDSRSKLSGTIKSEFKKPVKAVRPKLKTKKARSILDLEL